MPEGTVRWFNSEKGYGAIAPDGGGPDLFVHYSSIQMNGYKTLDELDRVSFDVVPGSQGPTAVTVTWLGDQGPAPPPPTPAVPRLPWWARWLSRR